VQPFAEYRKSRISDREDDYKKRRLQRQLSTTGSSYRDRMIETALEREHDVRVSCRVIARVSCRVSCVVSCADVY
jgi:hypothetical protein